MLWRKRQRTHLEIVISHELFAPRLPRRADTLHSVSISRRRSSGALLQLQVQLIALAVLQLQHADTPKFVSAKLWRREWTWSENGDESRETKDEVRCVFGASFTATAADGRGSAPCEQEVFLTETAHC
jgi:hypothetical protein